MVRKLAAKSHLKGDKEIGKASHRNMSGETIVDPDALRGY
jgi:hypothetical protein